MTSAETSLVPQATITSVRFRNFKALRQFTVSLQHMNMLVGPNNAGKSTIIGAFRVLAAALVRARTRNPERLSRIEKWGYPVADEAIPISMENIHTDYADVESTATFHLSNGRALTLLFPVAGGCFLLTDDTGKRITRTAEFKREFPVSIGFVPVLGPVEHEEELFKRKLYGEGSQLIALPGTSEATGTTIQTNLASSVSKSNLHGPAWTSSFLRCQLRASEGSRCFARRIA